MKKQSYPIRKTGHFSRFSFTTHKFLLTLKAFPERLSYSFSTYHSVSFLHRTIR
jgi:hypothetical protein